MANGFIRLPEDGGGKRLRTVEHNVDGVSVHAQAVFLVEPTGDTRTLTERMFAKAKTPGYQFRVDFADATHLYMAEAPAGSLLTDAVWRGIRMPLTEGAVQEAVNFAWATRTTAAWVDA